MWLRRTMSGSVDRMASEIRCLLFQKTRQFNCIIVIIFLYMFFLPLNAVRVEGGEGWGGTRRCRFVSRVVFFVVLVLLVVVLLVAVALLLVVVFVELLLVSVFGACSGGEGFWGCGSPDVSSAIRRAGGELGLVSPEEEESCGRNDVVGGVFSICSVYFCW